jgi:hypothetical protein
MKFICIENFTQIFKFIDVITFIYAYKIALLKITIIHKQNFHLFNIHC